MSLDRRDFVLASAAGCALVMAGCSWTPRNASSQEQTESPSSSGEQSGSASASTTENAPALDDGLILVKGGADMPQQVSDWLAENA